MTFESDANTAYVDGQPVSKSNVRGIWPAVDSMKLALETADATERSNRIGGVNMAGALRLTNLTGTADAFTAELSPGLEDQSVGTGQLIRWVAIGTSTVDGPVITIGGNARQIRDTNNGPLPAGGLVVGRSYLAEVHSNGAVRLLSSVEPYLDVKNRNAQLAALDSTVNVLNAAAIRGAILLPGIDSWSAQSITMTSDPSQAFIPVDLSYKIQIRWPVTNTGPDPTVILDGVTYTLRGRDGRTLDAGDLKGGSIYLGTFFNLAPGGIIRIMTALGVADINGLGSESVQLAANTSDLNAMKPAAADAEYLAENFIIRQPRSEGQTADMSGMVPTGTTSGSKTMVLINSTSYRYPNGGLIERINVYLNGDTRFSVSSWKEDSPGGIVPLTPHEVRYYEGVAGWNDVEVNIPIPKGGSVGFGVSIPGNVGVNSSLPALNLRATSDTENEPFTSSNFSFRYMVNFTVSEPVGLSIPSGDLVSPTLIDKRFTDADGWTLAGATIASGALESGANSADWAARTSPISYPYSQLSKRTASVFGEIVSAGQVWGLGFMRQDDGFDLLTPAASWTAQTAC
ncbi:hypothetical protein [Paracoccus methylarcula]|uniref:Uncharacterized protein n=1 Tax=Paracoccus methylarcula TaxID=72022 RepID=A0A422QSH1_9RHOB|nr:hypothetical protein [Paracoccus methylarcula]RNF32959.1 hypothetical protein A7A09_019290 [Paracoccus methylarcula]